MGIGSVPRSIWATLEDDLVDICKPGDDVKIWLVKQNYVVLLSMSLVFDISPIFSFFSGVVTRRWKMGNGSRQDIDLYLRVNYLSVSNNEKMSVSITNETIAQFEKFWSDNDANTLFARDLIVASICPQVNLFYRRMASLFELDWTRDA